MAKANYQITQTEAGQRLDAFLAKQAKSLSRAQIKKAILEHKVYVNESKSVKPSYRLQVQDQIQWQPEALFTLDKKAIVLKPRKLPLTILYEDQDLIVVNKPQGMLVHPTPQGETDTLVNALLAHVEEEGSQLAPGSAHFRPGIVHRLDKDTSGLLLVAKTQASYQALTKMLQQQAVHRYYWALVYGEVGRERGILKGKIKRQPVNRLAYEVNAHGRFAETHFERLRQYTGYSLLKLKLLTGRTHQIRVHLRAMGHPVVDDPLYASDHKQEFFYSAGQLLHARELAFRHPKTKEALHFTSALPARFEIVLKQLEVGR